MAQHIATGDAELDATLGGGWSVGAAVEVGGDLPPAVVAGLLIVTGPDADAAIGRADDAIAHGRVVAVRVPASDAARAVRLLGERARERGGAVVVLAVDETAALLAAQAQVEARMRAQVESAMLTPIAWAGGAWRVRRPA